MGDLGAHSATTVFTSWLLPCPKLLAALRVLAGWISDEYSRVHSAQLPANVIAEDDE